MAAKPISIIIEIIRLPHADGLPLPAYQTECAAGMDLCAAISENEPLMLKPSERALVPTGLVIQLPNGHEAQIRPRSGLAFKNGVTVLNSPGTIDSDYRGELQVLLINLGCDPFEISRGMRVAQMIIAPVRQAAIVEIRSVSLTKRGAGGFGSTGTKTAKMSKPVRMAGKARKSSTK